MPAGQNSIDCRRAVGLLAFALLCGCEQRETPSELRLELPHVIVSREVVAASVHAFNARGVSKSITDEANYAVQPSDLASVSKTGLLTCQRSGDGTLSVSMGGVSRSAEVRCRIVDHIEAHDVGRVELATGPFVPQVRVLDQAGRELSDVEVSFFSKNSGVLYPDAGRLVPKQVGTATVVARVGSSSREFKVDVVRKVQVEALPIEQNKKLYFSLEPGKYELKIALPSPHRVRVEWRGAPYCNTSSDGLEHLSVCALRAQSAGGVVFDNPAYLKDGSKTPSLDGVELNEVP